MKTNRKITFTVNKEEYEIVYNFFKFLLNLDKEVYEDVREVIMDDNNDFFEMVDALLASLDYPKDSTTSINEAIQTVANYCDNNNDCKICPLNGKCCDQYPYNWVNTSQS